MIRATSIAAAILLLGMPAIADEPKGDPYTLDVCAVAGEKLGSMGEPIIAEFEGREVRYCCGGCKPRLEGDSAKYLPEVDAKMIAAQKPVYPLDTDIVSGEALGQNAVDTIYKNRLFRFASKESKETFMKDPGKYWAKLDEAVIAKQQDSYPLTTCVTSGEELGSMGDPIHLVIANRMVSICCAGCERAVRKDPLAAFSKIDTKS